MDIQIRFTIGLAYRPVGDRKNQPTVQNRSQVFCASCRDMAAALQIAAALQDCHETDPEIPDAAMPLFYTTCRFSGESDLYTFGRIQHIMETFAIFLHADLYQMDVFAKSN